MTTDPSNSDVDSTAAEEDPYESEEYQRFVAEMAEFCTCDGPVCAGVLAGGLCDDIRTRDDNEIYFP